MLIKISLILTTENQLIRLLLRLLGGNLWFFMIKKCQFVGILLYFYKIIEKNGESILSIRM